MCLETLEWRTIYINIITHFVFLGIDGIVAHQLNQTSAFGAWVLNSLNFFVTKKILLA